METLNQGALIDTRTEEEKLSDIQFQEVVASSNPVVWVEKPRSEWKKFPIFNQNGSGSCVANTVAKMAGILHQKIDGTFITFSATHIYQRRANRPQAGMNYPDCFNIAEEGVTLEVLVPSQNMTDDQMDNVNIDKYKQEVGKIFKVGAPVGLVAGDMETVASTIQTTNKGIMVWFYFLYNEWQNVPRVIDGTLNLYGANTNRHSVTAVDFTLLGKINMPDNRELWGKKAIIIDDSWGVNAGFTGQRIITEDFFQKRNFLVAYTKNFKFEESVDPRPEYTFTKKLEQGMTDIDVLHLQEMLRYEGFFPVDQTLTMYYGALTAKGVLQWQLKYNLDTVSNLNLWKGRYFGDKSIAKANKLNNK